MLAALIPAYNPTTQLITFVRELSNTDFDTIIVVNDGASEYFDFIFEEIESIEKVTVLRHAVNLGKGAAIKTGLNHTYCYLPNLVGVVTIDADGQHLVPDALIVARVLMDQTECLVMGVRALDKGVPLRSVFGNILTKKLFRFLVGQKLTDTQSGLRGIPKNFIPCLLKIDSNGYEFELDMLLACKYSSRKIIEREIRTVYIEENKSSHFNPLLDSMKIYFVLFRFSFVSLFTAFIDYSVFIFTFNLSSNIAASQVSARLVAMIFNYSAVKKLVFYSEQKHRQTFPKYATLVLISGSVSFLLINLVIRFSTLDVVTAKVISELLVFLANFAIQRDFIFTKNNKAQTSTNWDTYYNKPYKTASFTRKITEKNLLQLIRRYVSTTVGNPVIAELGGANSCFFDKIRTKIQPLQYHIIDNNQFGLNKFYQRIGDDNSVILHNGDVLDLTLDIQFDLSFSVGLIEHFSVEDTKKAVSAHFKVLKPEGIAIISFPTPTFLYRYSRKVCELFGVWIFHDERPLTQEEVKLALRDFAEILDCKIIWPIFLTQMVIVARKCKI